MKKESAEAYSDPNSIALRLKAQQDFFDKQVPSPDLIKEALSEIFRPHTGGRIKLYDIKNGRTVGCQEVEKLYNLVYKEIAEADTYRDLKNMPIPWSLLWKRDVFMSSGVVTEKDFRDFEEIVMKLIGWRQKIAWKYVQRKDRISKKGGRALAESLVDLFYHKSKMSKEVALYSIAHILKHLDMENGSIETIFKRIKGDYYRKKKAVETDHI